MEKPLDSSTEEYFALKDDIIKAERRVLKELGFCVHLSHPHTLIISFQKLLGLEDRKVRPRCRKPKNRGKTSVPAICENSLYLLLPAQDLAQLAWNYMNDGLRTSVFLRFPVETISCAVLQLGAARLGQWNMHGLDSTIFFL